MADELRLKLALELEEAFKQIDALEKKLADALKAGGKGSKGPDLSAFKEYKDIARTASILTTRLGRDLDALVKQYGAGSKQVDNFVAKQLKVNQVSRLQEQAVQRLKKAFEDGAITYHRYKLELEKLANTQALFKNKMNMATPIRQMQMDLSGLTGVISTLNPTLGNLLHQVIAIKKAFGGFGPTATADFIPKDFGAVRSSIASIPEASAGASNAFYGMSAAMGAAAAAAGVLAVALAETAIASKAIATGAKFEDMEYQMAALINSTTKFKEKGSDNFVSFERNLELSLANAKKIIQTFVKDAPALAGTNLEELTQTASVTLGRLGAEGITDPDEQAKLIESMTVAIKTVTKGQQNAAVQLAQESRALLAGEFRSTNTLINQLAVAAGGKERFKALMKEAKEAGRLGEFLQEQLKPFVDAANFASGSLSNLAEVWEDVQTNFFKNIADAGSFQAFKDMAANLLKPFVELEDPARFGQIKQTVLDLANSISGSLSNLFNSLSPMMEPISQILLQIGRSVAALFDPVNALIAVASPFASTGLRLLADGLWAIAEVLNVLGDILKIATAAVNYFVSSFSGGIEETSTKLGGFKAFFLQTFDFLGKALSYFHKLAVLSTQDFNQAMVVMGQVAAGVGRNVSATFFNLVKNILDAIAGLIQKGTQSLQKFAAMASKIPGVGNLVSGAAMAGQMASFALKAGASAAAGKAMKDSASAAFNFNSAKSALNQVKMPSAGYGFPGNAGLGAGEDEKKKKGRTPRDKSFDANKLANAEADLEIAKEKTALEEKQAEIAKRKLELEEKLVDYKARNASNDVIIDTQKHQLDNQIDSLDLESKRISFLEKTNQITEAQSIELQRQNSLKKNQVEYEKDLLDYQKQKQAYFEKTTEATFKQSELKTDVDSKQAELDSLNKQIAIQASLVEKIAQTKNKQGEEDKQRLIDENKQLQSLVDKRTAAESALKKIKSTLNNQQKNDAAELDVEKQKLDLFLKKIEDEKTNKDATVNQGAQFAQAERSFNDSIFKTFIDAGKGLFGDIVSAFKEGGDDVGKKLLQALQNFGNKIMDALLNKAVNGIFGDGSGGGGFLSGLFGGSSGGLGIGQSLQKNSEGIFGIYDQAGQLVKDLGTSCGISAKKMVGAGDAAGGLGGIFSNLIDGISGLFSGGGIGPAGGGFGGALGAIGSVAGIGLGIGSTIFGFLSSNRKKKKQEHDKKIIQEITSIADNAFKQIDSLEVRLEARLDSLSDSFKETERAIGKIDINNSILNLSKVIQQTSGMVLDLDKTIGNGSNLKINKKYFDAYWQGMQTLYVGVNGLGKSASGLFAQRNKEIRLLLNEQMRIQQITTTEGASSGAIEKAGLEQIDAISQKIIEVNKKYNDQIKDLTGQRQDYVEKIEEYIKQQKELIKDFDLEFGRNQSEALFGDIGGDMFDQIAEFSEKVRNLLASGFNPDKVAFVIERQALKLQQDLAEQAKSIYSEFTDKLLGLQDELFSALNEGRATGLVQQSQEDKINEIRRRIQQLYKEQETAANSGLAQLGGNLDKANEALAYFTQQLQDNYLEALSLARSGQTDLDRIQVEVFGTDAIADAVQKKIDSMLSLPGALRSIAV